MAWVDIDSGDVHTMVLADSVLLNALAQNLVYLYGDQAGQTEIEIEDAVNLYNVRATSAISLVKRYETGDGGAVFVVEGQDTDDTESSLDDHAQTTLEFGMSSDLISRDIASTMACFVNQSGSPTGIVFAQGSATTPPYTSAMFSVLQDNSVIIGKRHGGEAEHTTDVFVNGDVNVTGSYYIDNAALSDWTETLGSPNRLDWTGNAQVDRWAANELQVTSTTMVDGLSAGLLNGYAWHTPLFKATVGGENCTTSYVESGVTSVLKSWNAGITLDRVGEWFIVWCGNFSYGGPSSSANLASLQMAVQSGGATIGPLMKVTCLGGYIGSVGSGAPLIGAAPVMLSGGYTSAGGNETIVVKAKVDSYLGTGTGTVQNCWEGCMAAFWVGP